MSVHQRIQSTAETLQSSNLRREAVVRSRDLLSFGSNDYLGLSDHPRVISAAQEALREGGLGSASARLLSGTSEKHQQLEVEMARFLQAPDCVLFSSGYLANVGVLSTIVGRGDVVVADRFVHGSLLDGIQLSGARCLRFQHNDVQHAAQCISRARESIGRGQILLVTESVFSMDGDLAPLDDLNRLAVENGITFLIDEAHALGVFGASGQGRFNHAEHIIRTGTLSKSFGSYGGIVSGATGLRSVLLSRSRAFIFNTSLPPAVVAGALAALEIMKENPGMGKQLLAQGAELRACFQAFDFEVLGSASQIVPVVIGDTEHCLALSKYLETAGYYVPAIRRPTVPAGTERLRFSVTLKHRTEDFGRLAGVVVKGQEWRRAK